MLRKLLGFHDGEGVSGQQWRDVVGLLATRAGLLDEEYLRRWAAKLGLTELLGRAARESRE